MVPCNSEPKKAPLAEGGPLEAPPEGPPEAPPEDATDDPAQSWSVDRPGSALPAQSRAMG